jgi:hypothetical protein
MASAPLRRSGAEALEFLLAFALAALFYVSLYGELPYHDAARFAAQLASDRFVYDLGHVLLQPAALLWHRWLGFGEPVMASQKHISTFATAAAVAIFYRLLVRLGTARWLAVLAAVLVAASCSIITLAPSAHFKLVALPFTTGALAVLTLAEAEGRARRPAVALAGGALLAVGAGFFAGVLATPPFAGLALLVAARREGAAWPRALLQAVLLGAACAGLFALLAGGTYALINAGPLSRQGFAAALDAKQAVRPTDHSVVNQAARAVFSTVNDFVAAPGLGAVARAWISGQIPTLRPYAPVLLPILLPWAATAAILAATYLRAVAAVLRGRRCLVPIAFLVGALVWAVGYNLNDPEHWVNLTAPTVLLFVTLFPPVAVGVGLPIWSALTIAVNLVLFAIPTATYPLARYEAAMQAQFTPRDLLIHFAAYPGRAYLGFFDLQGLREFKLDLTYEHAPNLAAFFAVLDQAITDTLHDGGRVMVFDVLDGSDWEAPWPTLTVQGLTKDRLYSHLASHFAIVRQPSIADLKVWQITAAPGT